MRKTINQELAVASDIHCKKLTWMLLHHPERLKEIEVSLTTKEGREEVSKAAAKMFAERNILHLEYRSPVAMMCCDTEEAIENETKEYINGATFAVEDLICRPEYIRVYNKKEIGLYAIHMCLEAEMTEDGTKKGSKNQTKFIEDVAKLSFQYFVLNKLGYKVKSCTIYYVNKEYTKPGKKQAYNNFFASEEILEQVQEHQVVTEVSLNSIRELMKNDTEPKCEGLSAKRCITTPCTCFDICNEELGGKDSIVWKISGLYKDKKCSLINAGCTTAENVFQAHLNGTITLNENQARQVEFYINNTERPYVVKDELEDFMNATFRDKSRIVFFDFESYMYVLPKFENLQPYTQLPFQWSAHTLNKETMEIKHSEFLGAKGKDPREACARKIITLPHDSDTVWIAYNMGFEKGVIRNLAKYLVQNLSKLDEKDKNELTNIIANFDEKKQSYEDLIAIIHHFSSLVPNGDEMCDIAAKLMYIRSLFCDLMIPFRKQWYYSNLFAGSYSIKYVLPGLFPNAPRLNYHNLIDIRNGVDAQRGYLQMQKKKGKELAELKHNMLEYCKLDTWAMVMVYSYLKAFLKYDCEIIQFKEEELEKEYKII